MRVLMTTDTVGGVWTYAIELSRALEPHGVEVVLATMGAPIDVRQRAQVNMLQNVYVRESAYKLEWMQDPWEDVARAGDWLLELADRHRPDVVHLNGYVHGGLDWAAPALVVGHSCVLSWWRAVKEKDAPDDWDRYRAAVTNGIRKADAVIAPSEAILRELRRYYAPLPPSRVIHNGRDASLFAPGDKEPFILSAGRLWDEAKNLVALEAASEGLPWPTYVAGEDRFPGGKSVRVRHAKPLGKLSEGDLAAWLGRASIYALPAKYEPFGLSVLEAALSGCALVLGDIPSLREIWDDAATFVPPDDAAALRHAIRSLIDDPARRGRMMRRAREHALRYTATWMALAYFNTYRELTSGASDRATPTVSAPYGHDDNYTTEERPSACAS
jgi:glycogen synthase